MDVKKKEEFEFSPEQKNIIFEPINNNLVSASAGAGKTTVLTARIGEEVVKGNVSVDSILVVTFTEDAAANVADKIEEKLVELRNKAAEEAKTDKSKKELADRLSSQIDILPNAYIQTMHGFCSRVIKEKGYLLEDGPFAEFTDPSCRIITGSEQDVLLNSAAEYAIRDMYESSESEDSPFVRFTRRFGDGRSDGSLVGTITGIYKTLRSLPDYLDVCDSFVRKREENDEKGLINGIEEDDEITREITDYLLWVKTTIESSDFQSSLETHKDDYQFVSEMTNDEFVRKVTDIIGSILEEAKTHKGADFFACLESLKELDTLTYNNITKKVDLKGDDSSFIAIVSLRRFINQKNLKSAKYDNPYDLPGEFSNLIGLSKIEILNNQKAGTEAVRVFVELLKRTDRFYVELKSVMHGMDFSDLEHTAYEIMKTEEGSSFYREKFKEIFVDEYQDNTRLQDKIIETFEDPSGNVFRVGDIKQSIYKFRFADPKIFGTRIKEINEGKQKGKVWYLRENHRSTSEILAFANYVCEQIMSKEASEIEYDEAQHLTNDDKKHGPVPRIVVVDKSAPKKPDADKKKDEKGKADKEGAKKAEVKKEVPADDPEDDETKREKKAVLVAVESEVRRYLEEGTRIDGKKPELKDIFILTASNNQAEEIAGYLNGKVLKDGRKIEASGRFTTDVFEDLDIHRLINFIISLGNSYRDEYLAGVMLSNYRFSNFTVEELARIQAFIHEFNGGYLGNQPLMLRLRVFAENDGSPLAESVQGFIDVFDRIRMSSMVMDIDDIIELIYRETGIRATLEQREGDSSKFDFFKDWLSSSFKSRGSDISGIANELERMKIKIKGADIEVTDANKDKITTMTVHKSKGLERPFVILVATGGRDEQKDKIESIMFDRDLGFITEDYDSEQITRKHSLEQRLYKMKMKLAANAETCRLLYVALTRAKENLSVITTCDFVKDKASNVIRDAFVQAVDYEKPAFDVRHWLMGDMKLPYVLMSALARSADGEKLRELARISKFNPCNIYPFRDLKGNVVKGFEVVTIPQAEVDKLYVSDKTGTSSDEDKDENRYEFKDGKLDFPDYDYQDYVDVPFKVSVTGMAGDNETSKTTHVDMQIRSVEDFDSSAISVLTASAKGTILHRIMRFIDLEGIKKDTVSFEDEINTLITDGYLSICSPADALKVAEEFKEGIITFCKDDRCDDIVKSFEDRTARSEKPIVFSIYVKGDTGDSQLVQGVIDLIYKDKDGYTILDYKTDKLEGKTPEERAAEAAERHGFQLRSYAAACEEDGYPVAHKVLYLVRYGEFVEV